MKAAILAVLLCSLTDVASQTQWKRRGDVSHFCCKVNTIRSVTKYSTQAIQVTKSTQHVEKGIQNSANPIFQHSEHSWFLGIPKDPPKDKYSVKYHVETQYVATPQIIYHQSACPIDQRKCCTGYRYYKEYNNCLSEREKEELDARFSSVIG